MFRTYRYPLRPTKAQEATLNTWLAQCCDLHNAALQERREAWKKQRVKIGYNGQAKGLKEWRDSDPDGAALPYEVQRSALRRVDLAFKAFFRRCKSGQTPGYPRFKSKRRYDSLSAPTANRCARVIGNRVSLPKLANIKFHRYRPLIGKVLQVTVRRERDGEWSVSFACDVGPAPDKVDPVSIVGIDVGIKSLVATSDGDIVENPRHAERAAAKLARLQRIVRRRKRGSRSRERARIQVAKCHAHIRHQRLDHARKTAKRLVGKYDVVAYEDLDLRAMARGQLSKHINDAGWRQLTNAIDCKAESAGKWSVAVNPYGTTQRCSGCGADVHKELRDRVHDCPACGLVLDRDENAARNICALGRSAVSELGALGQVTARSAA